MREGKLRQYYFMDSERPAFLEYVSHAEKRTVAMHSVLTALALTAMKLAAGLGSNSLGILSEAAN